jgi:hypothetical protein
MKIFISGSISIKKLDIDVLQKLDFIINKKYKILLGDAKGIDLLVQQYLYSCNYNNVIIYSTGNPRNNLFNWDNKKIFSNKFQGTIEFFTVKDIELTKDCNYGFVIWDEKSKGSLNNIKRLKEFNKKVLIYLNKQKKFIVK